VKVTIDGVEYSPVVHTDWQQPLAHVLKHAREASGQTLDQVATAVGTSKGNLWGLENGKSNPGFAVATRLLRHYHISADRVK